MQKMRITLLEGALANCSNSNLFNTMTGMLNTNYYYIDALSDWEKGLLNLMPSSRRALIPLPARAHLF
jgi:hypothetical protein